MLDNRLGRIENAVNGLASAVSDLGAIFGEFFRAYAKAKVEGGRNERGFELPAAAVWSAYLEVKEES